MKIGIQTWGSEGDIKPLLALAAGLRTAGHDVTLAVTHVTNKDYVQVGALAGVPVRQIGHLDPVLTKRSAETLARETNMLKQVRIILRDLFEPAVQDMFSEAKLLCRENELVIGHFLVHPLKAAAELDQRPHVSVFLAPLLPSSSYPPPGVPHLGSMMNKIFWKAGGALMDRMFLPAVNSLRQAGGLAPLKNVVRDVFFSPRLNLVASSPALIPRPSDWDEAIQLCGAFHFPEQREAVVLPDPLRRFLAAGPPPVYMTIGSMSLADPVFSDTLRLLTDSARIAECRALVQTEGAAISPDLMRPDIFFIDRLEHDLVFPRCAAVVHHGGAGTTHAASRAGCPSIVVEHVTDQAFWGGVLHRAGIAPPLLHRRTVTADKLARSIRAVLGSSSMQEKARMIGERMRREYGVTKAVELIEGQSWS